MRLHAFLRNGHQVRVLWRPADDVSCRKKVQVRPGSSAHTEVVASVGAGSATEADPSRNFCKSSANAEAREYRSAMFFSRHFRQIASSSLGIAALICRGGRGGAD